MSNIYIFIIETPWFTSAIGLAQRFPRIWRLDRNYFFSRSHPAPLSTICKIVEKPCQKIIFFLCRFYLFKVLQICRCRLALIKWNLENNIPFLVFMQTHQQSINFSQIFTNTYKNRTFVVALNFIFSSINKTKPCFLRQNKWTIVL